MSLITPEVGGRSFECCEAVTVDPNGSGGSRVWLLNGDTIIYNTVSAAALAALIVNADGDPLMHGPVTSPTFGEGIYIAAQNVAQLRQLSAVPPSTQLALAGGPVNVIVSELAATLIAAFNLTARCGGAAAPPTPSNYVDSGAQTLGATGTAGVVATISEDGQWTRVGAGPTPQDGDVITLSFPLTLAITGDVNIGVNITNLPFEPAGPMQVQTSVQNVAGTLVTFAFQPAAFGANSVVLNADETSGGNANYEGYVTLVWPVPPA